MHVSTRLKATIGIQFLSIFIFRNRWITAVSQSHLFRQWGRDAREDLPLLDDLTRSFISFRTDAKVALVPRLPAISGMTKVTVAIRTGRAWPVCLSPEFPGRYALPWTRVQVHPRLEVPIPARAFVVPQPHDSHLCILFFFSPHNLSDLNFYA